MATEQRLIDANPIKKFIEDGLNNPDLKKAFGYDAIEILAEIEYAPTVDAVEVVHGRWDHHASMARTPFAMNYDCSVCGNESAETTNYCPNCGAKMDAQ